MAAKFELYTDKAGEFRFRLKAGNGENIGASEGYKAKSSALNGIESVKKHAQDLSLFDIFEGKNNKYYFNLKARNHQVILSSQGYASEAGAQKGTEAVQRAAAEATLHELS